MFRIPDLKNRILKAVNQMSPLCYKYPCSLSIKYTQNTVYFRGKCSWYFVILENRNSLVHLISNWQCFTMVKK